MTGRRRFRLRMRGMMTLGGVVAIAAGLTIVGFGLQRVEEIRTLARDGAVAQGRYLGTRGGSGSRGDEVSYAYTVAGRDYRVTSLARSTDVEPIFGPVLIDNPRFGPANPAQVIYLRSDPANAAMRSDLDVSRAPFLLGGGFFVLIGAVFVVCAQVLLRRRGGRG